MTRQRRAAEAKDNDRPAPELETAKAGESDAPAVPRLDQFLCFAVYAAGHAFNRVYKPLLDELGLTYPQYLAMVALWEKDDQTVGSLGTQLMLESSTLTPLLKRLEAMGQVTRARDSEDERVVRVRLTPKGRALKAKATHIPSCILTASGMTMEELGRLQAQVAGLRQALENSAHKARP